MWGFDRDCGANGFLRCLGVLIILGLVVSGVFLSFQKVSAGATITVNTTDDEWNNDGDCSLREAIAAANWDQPIDACTPGAGDDTIMIPAGTYTLSLAGVGEDIGGTGDLDIVSSVTIQGAGMGATIIDGGNLDRVFDVQPFVPELIIINEIMKNPDQVADSAGEWIELYNPGTSEVDINGWTIKDDGVDSHVIDYGSPLMVPAGGYLILAREYDPLLNGGVSVDYEYASFQLANTADEVVLMDDSLIEIDRVNYDDGVLFPDPTGASISLKLPRADNNDGANWCTATSSFGDGDLGTPGSENDCISNPSTLIQVSISDLTVRNGSESDAGGIRNQADLSLDRVAVQSNSGSGIYHGQGTLLITDSQISANSQSGISAFKASSPLLTIQTHLTDITGNEGSGINCINTYLSVTGGTIASNGSSGVSGNGCVMQFAGATIENNITTGNGAGINSNNAAPTLTNTTVQGNTAAGVGGGIYYWGLIGQEMQMTGGSLTDNQAQDGGGLYVAAAAAVLDDVELYGNEAQDDGGGIYVGTENNASVDLLNGTMVGAVGAGNTADADLDMTGAGGGIYNLGEVFMEDAFVQGNTGAGIDSFAASGPGPSVEVVRSEISSNSSSGISAINTLLTINQSLIDNNQWGGIWAMGSPLQMTESTVKENLSPGDGGGLALLNVSFDEISGSTVAGNTSGGEGGGIYFWGLAMDGTLEITNSTISGNQADGHGGGVMVASGAGSILEMSGVTLAANIADSDDVGNDGDGGGIHNGAGGLVKIKHTLMAANQDATTSAGTQYGQTCVGTLQSYDYNFIDRNAPAICTISGGGSDIIGDFFSPIDAAVGSLAGNGGLTETHALMSDSPAVNAGELGPCTDADGNPFSTDQRGVNRPQASRCDIGAFEYEFPFSLYLPLISR